MSYNRSLLTQITKDLNKKPSKPKVPKNQWQHPGEITNIPSNNITMDAVSYPVLGVPNIGQPQMMYPDQQYHYPEADNVTEYPMMRNGGYTVTRSHDRKGKTHKVTGPDGTVKYFGDSSMGQHPKDPERKKAFYARHKKNLAGNPYFRAFARATWAEGGEYDNNVAYADTTRVGNVPRYIRPTNIRGPQDFSGLIKGADIATDIMQLGHFIPHPVAQGIAFAGDFLGAGIDGYQAIDEATKGNYGAAGINAATAILPSYLKSAGYLRDIHNAAAGSLAERIAKFGSKAGNYRPLTALPRLANNPIINKGINANRKVAAALALETAYDQHKYGGLTKYQKAGPVIKPVNGFIDLSNYGVDVFTPEGIAKAEELNKQYPGSKFYCTANGCADIASKVANAYGHDFGRFNAWDAGNQNPVGFINPRYTQAMFTGTEPLPNPTSYQVPSEVLAMQNKILTLNRRNNLMDTEGNKLVITPENIKLGKSKDRKSSNDSFDYKYNYPNSRGMEHAGYLRDDNTLIHGTSGHGDQKAWFIFDNIADGIKLPGYGKYDVVEAIDEPSSLRRGWNRVSNSVRTIGDAASNLISKVNTPVKNTNGTTNQEATLVPNYDFVRQMLSGLVKPKSQFGGTGNFLPPINPMTLVNNLLPVNAKSLVKMGINSAAKSLGFDNTPINNIVTKQDFNKQQLQAIYNAAMNAKKRTGKNTDGTKYSDYGASYGDIWGRGLANIAKDSYIDPAFQAATTLGRFTYNFKPDGTLDLTDIYDFNHESKGAIQNAVKAVDRNLGNDPSKNVRFTITPSDFKKRGGQTPTNNWLDKYN